MSSRSATSDQVSRRRLSRFPVYLVALFLVPFLTACVTLPDPEASQEYTRDAVATVSGGQTIGQTFISRRPRLNQVTLLDLSTPGGDLDDTLTVKLFHTPDDPAPVYTAYIPVRQLPKNGALTIPIPPQPGPAGQSYYLAISTDHSPLIVYGRNEDAYPSGQAYLGTTSLDADLAFRLSYEYGPAAMFSDLLDSLTRLWLLLPFGVALLIPGWLILDLLGWRRRFDPGEQIGLSIGLSLASVPIVMLWTTQIGLRWNRTGVLLVGGVLALMFTFRLVKGWRLAASEQKLTASEPPAASNMQSVISNSQSEIRNSPFSIRTPQSTIQNPPFSIRNPKSTIRNSFALLAIFTLTLLVRLAMTRDLTVPAWVDSVHHATITRTIVEHGGFSKTYAPYIEIESIEYHAGFHANLAFFHWLSGLEIPKAMLLYGQVLNALIVFAVYVLTTSLTRDRIAGIFAALVAGLFTPMPAYYASWGRYPQLAGLLILPVVVVFVRQLLEENRGVVFVSAIAFGGLFLVHYRVAAFLICLLLPYFLSHLRFNRHQAGILIKKATWFWIATAFLAILLTLPWTLPTITQVITPALSKPVNTQAKMPDLSWTSLRQTWNLFWKDNGRLLDTVAWGRYSLILAGGGLALGFILRRSMAFTLTLWVAFLFLLANLGRLGLPGKQFVNLLSVTITLFMPVAVLAGFLVGRVTAIAQRLVPQRWHPPFQWGLALTSGVVALLAGRALLPILNPITILFHASDQSAMTWIEQNIPADETILINPFLWGYGTYAGNDGGYWISPLAGRKTIPPPVIAALDAKGWPELNDISRQAIEKADEPVALWEYMSSKGIRYLYVGARGGVFSPKVLDESGLFQPLYAQDGIWLFKIVSANN